jgi:hypothetical protein
METIDGAIYSIIKQSKEIQEIVEDRIYPGTLPDDCKFPAISFFKVSKPFDRVVGAPRFQFDLWSRNYLGVQVLANILEDYLDGFAGDIGGFEIKHIAALEAPDFPFDEKGLYHIPYDFLVIYQK